MKKNYKLQKILTNYMPGEPLLTKGLSRSKPGIYQYLYALKKRQWLLSLGYGAFMIKGHKLSLFGALYALQRQTRAPVHIGGLWAIALLAPKMLWNQKESFETFTGNGVFAPARFVWPKWCKTMDWDLEVAWSSVTFLPKNYGFTFYRLPQWPATRIKISNPPRALLEALYLAHSHEDLLKVYDLINAIKWLSASYCQRLLEGCQSFRVRRLFLALSDYAEGSWLEKLDVTQIALGTTKYPKPKEPGFAYCKKSKLFLPMEIVFQEFY